MKKPNPHDALFRAVFSHPENAMGQLQAMLPLEVSQRMHWKTLTLQNGSFTDESLSNRESDLLYQVRMGSHSVHLYLLFEHQSTPDRWMPFRLLRYMMRIWDRWIAEHPTHKKLPAIIPLVLVQVKGGWKTTTQLHQLYALDDQALELLGSYLPNFTFALDDLSQQPEEQLRQRVATHLAILTLLLLRNIRGAPDIRPEIEKCKDLIEHIWRQAYGRDALEMVVRYIALANRLVQREHVIEALHPVLGPAIEEVTMGFIAQARAEGKEEGKAEGKAEGEAIGIAKGKTLGLAEGKMQNLLRLCQAHGLELSEVQRARILTCHDPIQLDEWFERALTASSAQEVLGED